MVAACWASLESNCEAVELGHPVDDPGHRCAEALLDRLEGDAGVLDRVVQQRGGDRRGVEAQVGHDGGHGDGVGDVGLARAAQLAGVGLGGHPAGLDDERRCPRRAAAAPAPAGRAPAGSSGRSARCLGPGQPEPGSPCRHATRPPQRTKHPSLRTNRAFGASATLLAALACPLAGAAEADGAVPGPGGRALAPLPLRAGAGSTAGGRARRWRRRALRPRAAAGTQRPGAAGTARPSPSGSPVPAEPRSSAAAAGVSTPDRSPRVPGAGGWRCSGARAPSSRRAAATR